MRRRTKWLIGIGVAALAVVAGLFIAGTMMVRRFEPYVRKEAMQYLSDRFDSDVNIQAIHVHMQTKSPWMALKSKGRGVLGFVEADGISLKRHNSPIDQPLFKIATCRFEVDLGTLMDPQTRIQSLLLDNVEITIPPRGDRSKDASPTPASNSQPQLQHPVIFEHVLMRNVVLAIQSNHLDKPPLRFDIHSLELKSAGLGVAMNYNAVLTNAKPPGEIKSIGMFGPWDRDEPGDTPLAGDYNFTHADLGVFAGIAGTLESTGAFNGTLSAVTAKGQATVPDFRLKGVGNAMPLVTRFEVLVDGTNGDTVLKPVQAKLGSTNFTTSGAVLKKEGAHARLIKLDVNMPHGYIQDLLRLAVKGSPMMEGQIMLKTQIEIPPLSGDIADKLRLNGEFQLSQAKFMRSSIQDQIDNLSRKGQGQPKNEEIDDVLSRMFGAFRLNDRVIDFSNFSFSVPGAAVHLAGDFNLDKDILDFHGDLKLQAKVSQTQTGWKRWALKPVDPFFAKNGAGTFLHIVVDGSSKKPHFGLDRGHKDEGGKPQITALR